MTPERARARRRWRGLAALALTACASRDIDPSALEARYPALRALRPHPLGETRPYALPLDASLALFLCRWPTPATLGVAFEGEPDATQEAALAAALRAWEGAGLGLRFERVAEREHAAIRVRLRDDWITSQADTIADCAVDGPPAAGAAQVPGARLVSASVHVARADPHLRETLLHELGHALGFQGHARSGRTLMLARESDVLERARAVSASAPLEDAALRALYTVPPGALVAMLHLDAAQTRAADRLAALAGARSLAGPFVRVGDREGLVFWLEPVGRRLGLRVEGLGDVRRRPDALRLVPASRAVEALLGAARPLDRPARPVDARRDSAQNAGVARTAEERG